MRKIRDVRQSYRLAVVLVVAAALASLFGACARHPVVHRAAIKPPTQAPLAANPLNGLMVVPRAIRHRVAAIMIDNHPHARPQIGLRGADVVYEAEAEGGITRYMALYLNHTPKVIGPVRSARLYFVNFALPYDPYFAHVGENDDVWGPLAELKSQGFADFEQIVGAPEPFWRDWSLPSPHNMFTSIALLRKWGPRYNWPDRPYHGEQFAFDPWRVIVDDPPDVELTFWRQYTVRYRYQRGSYLRYVAGVLQHDAGDRRPYRVADVITTWMPARIIDSQGDLIMRVFGTFPAVLAHDGKFYAGKWIAPGPDSMPQFVRNDGKPVELSRGQIYIEILPQGGALRIGKKLWTYSPEM